jgi:tRNA-splicing ligase RtcB
MPVVLADSRVVNWASQIEDATIAQAQKASRLPFVIGHVALMPDAHVGIGATVGSVIPTKGAIIPSAVGVDIGCGMIAARTPLVADTLPDHLDKLHGWIAEVVPAGVGKGHKGSFMGSVSATDRYKRFPEVTTATEFTQKQFDTAWDQFGTLGSGNHFIEVCLDQDDQVWIVLHSGSRGIGNQLARIHMETAKGLMRQWFIELEDPDLAFLAQGTDAFDAYIADMLWAQRYAAASREQMLDEVLVQLRGFVGFDFEVSERINCHHNYSQLEHHRKQDVWVTRKGAIKAARGDLGVIPGSMGTSSYIVRGLGNSLSWNSCSHGAGRRMSRTQARRELTEESLVEAMAGKAWNQDAKTLLDEHPASYKDIDQVMEDQRDLVEVVATLRQILNYKGA